MGRCACAHSARQRWGPETRRFRTEARLFRIGEVAVSDREMTVSDREVAGSDREVAVHLETRVTMSNRTSKRSLVLRS